MTAAQPTPKRQEAHTAVRILVVDDDADFGETLAWILRYKGHEVRTARNGLEAVAAVVAQPFDVIFLDVRLPGLTGYDLARWVRGQAGGKRPHLIAVTGYGGDEERRTAAEAGIDQFHLKPLDPTHLDELLAAAG